ncbi:MAG TPA: T9SS type A sorting domain-containing protein, partial [Chitinophagaceae bacterium]
VDAAGNLYLGGTFSGSLTGESAINSNGEKDIYIIKYTSSGEFKWIKNIGTSGNDTLADLTIDQNNHLRIVGVYSGTLSLGQFILNDAGGAGFTASFDVENGNVLFAVNYHAPASGFLQMDNYGNIYYAGYASSPVTIGGITVTPQCRPIFNSTNSIFWGAKLDTSATVQWVKDLVPCDNMTGLGYYRSYLDFFVNDSGMVYTSFIEGRWPEFIGPNYGDPYFSNIAIYSTDGDLIERRGIMFYGFLGAGDINRYILNAIDKKVLLRNTTFNQLEFVKNFSVQGPQDILTSAPAINYSAGLIDTTKDVFYFTGRTFQNKLGKELEVNAGADKYFCGADAITFTLGGYPAAACGQGAFRYLWTPSTGLNNDTISNPEVQLSLLPFQQTYILRVTDAAGNIKRDTVEIIKYAGPAKPVITADNNVLFANVQGIGMLKWYLGDSLLTAATGTSYSFTHDGKYRVKFTDNNSCFAFSDTFYAYRITVNAGRDTAICSGQSIQLGGNPTASSSVGTLTYEWLPATYLNNNSIANPVSAPASAINYKLIVRNNFGNNAVDSISLSLLESPAVVITQTGNVLHSGYPSGNQWYLNGQLIPNESGESLSITNPGIYTVRVTNNQGCSVMSAPYNAALSELTLAVYPSIPTSVINIRYNLPVPAATTIEIFNLGNGTRRTILQNVRREAGLNIQLLNKALFPKGIYLVRITTPSGQASSKFIIQ